MKEVINPFGKSKPAEAVYSETNAPPADNVLEAARAQQESAKQNGAMMAYSDADDHMPGRRRHIKEIISEYLRDQDLWHEIQPWVTGKETVSGNEQMDRGEAARLVLEHDKKFGDGQITSLMENDERINRKYIGGKIKDLLDKRFITKRGRIIGEIEYKPK